MAPGALVGILTAGGFGVRLEGGRLIVHPADTLSPRLAGLIRQHKPALVQYLSRIQAPSNDTEQGIPRRLWLVTHADGRLVSHSFTPPATREDVAAWYADALSVEAEEVMS